MLLSISDLLAGLLKISEEKKVKFAFNNCFVLFARSALKRRQT